jgi:hypothetical protein
MAFEEGKEEKKKGINKRFFIEGITMKKGKFCVKIIPDYWRIYDSKFKSLKIFGK